MVGVLLGMGTLLGYGEPSDPPGRVGRLSYVSGPVSFAPAALEDEWSVASLNRPVTSGDHLWTDDGGRAEIHVGSTAIRLSERTNVDVLNLDDQATQLRIVQGSMNVRVRHVAPESQFEINTPTVALEIQSPGDYRIDVDPSGEQTTVSVWGGEVRVTGANTSFILTSDQSVTIDRDSQNYDINRLPASDSFDRFCLARDRPEDDSRSERHVSRNMTGYEDLETYGTWKTTDRYGTVWYPSKVSTDWAPYRDGHWLWVEPWGWTWVDNAPWGFAPFHYGRWVSVRGRWGWSPGAVQSRPVYAPALVAFVGGSGVNLSVSVGRDPAVGWFPIGYREQYVPWYSASTGYGREVNVAHVTNVSNVTNINNITYVNRNIPSAITAVPGAAFSQARPVRQAMIAPVARQELSRAPILAGAVPIGPTPQSLFAKKATGRPPEAVRTRSVVAVTEPPLRATSFQQRQAESAKNPDAPFKVSPLPAPKLVLEAESKTTTTGGPSHVRLIRPDRGANDPPSTPSATPATPVGGARHAPSGPSTLPIPIPEPLVSPPAQGVAPASAAGPPGAQKGSPKDVPRPLKTQARGSSNLPAQKSTAPAIAEPRTLAVPHSPPSEDDAKKSLPNLIPPGSKQAVPRQPPATPPNGRSISRPAPPKTETRDIPNLPAPNAAEKTKDAPRLQSLESKIKPATVPSKIQQNSKPEAPPGPPSAPPEKRAGLTPQVRMHPEGRPSPPPVSHEASRDKRPAAAPVQGTRGEDAPRPAARPTPPPPRPPSPSPSRPKQEEARPPEQQAAPRPTHPTPKERGKPAEKDKDKDREKN